MRRGEVWTLAGGGDFVGKPRPVVVIQDDRFELASATVCPFTTNTTEAARFRVEIDPAPDNGLEERSFAMADKVTTVRQTRLRNQIGHLNPAQMAALTRALLIFLVLTTEVDAGPTENETTEG